MKSTITSRDDLPFTTRNTTDDFVPWHPNRDLDSHESGRQAGLAAVDAIGQLAHVDEYEAHTAIVQLLISPNWNPRGPEELGVADGLARLVMIGLRAQQHSDDMPFETRFDPLHAQWCSLNTRVALAEAQLKKAKMKPWRSFEEAGMA
jgi:hypothetical protein